jgi:hypothetical protein
MNCDRKTARLARLVIHKQFGPIVAKIAQSLLENGRSTLRNLMTSTELTRKPIQEALFILIQHGLVKYSETVQSLGRILVHYVAIEREILLRDRCATYISIARSRLGDKAAEIIEHLLVNGVQSHDSLITSCGIDATISFQQLVKTKLIIESKSKDSLFARDTIMQEENAVVEKMGVPLTKIELTKLRKKLASERAEANEGPAPKKTKLMSEDAIEEDAAIVIAVDGGSRWRLNLEMFHVDIKIQEISNLAKRTINDAAGDLLEIIMRFKMHELKANSDFSSKFIVYLTNNSR